MKIQFIELAEKLAEKSDHVQHRFGAVLVNKHKIISVGWNLMKTHPKCKTYDNYLHAEIHCLLGHSLEQTVGCTLYICRVKRSGKRGMSKPCPVCDEALRRAGVKKVFYTNDSDEIIELNLR